MILAERILDAFRQPYLVGVHAGSITSTASIGVAVGPIEMVDSLQMRADQALYRAKAGGRDQAARYVETLDDVDESHEG